MAKVTYNKQLTALLVIDPYNDFIYEGGKIWDRVRDVAEANNQITLLIGEVTGRTCARTPIPYAATAI